MKFISFSIKRILIASACVITLVLLRRIFTDYYPDPFSKYFTEEVYSEGSNFPEVNKLNYFFYLIFRFLVNSLFSIMTIYFIFKNTIQLKIISKIFVFTGIGLIISYLTSLYFVNGKSYQVAFYLRRMIIHPFMLIIVLAGIIYQKYTQKIENGK